MFTPFSCPRLKSEVFHNRIISNNKENAFLPQNTFDYSASKRKNIKTTQAKEYFLFGDI